MTGRIDQRAVAEFWTSAATRGDSKKRALLATYHAVEPWETTLDPQKRILMRVQLDEASRADELFRTLMGEKVEPRREFIQKHALEVKDIDYHGA